MQLFWVEGMVLLAGNRTGAHAAATPQQPVLSMPSPTVLFASVTALFGAVLSGAIWVSGGLAVERRCPEALSC